MKDILPFINGMAHITGGGFNNISRINGSFDYIVETLPRFDEIPSVLEEMAERSGLSRAGLYTTFNMGVGMVWVAEPEDVDSILSATDGYVIGKLENGDKGVDLI